MAGKSTKYKKGKTIVSKQIQFIIDIGFGKKIYLHGVADANSFFQYFRCPGPGKLAEKPSVLDIGGVYPESCLHRQHFNALVGLVKITLNLLDDLLLGCNIHDTPFNVRKVGTLQVLGIVL